MENGKLSIGKHIADLRKQKGITQETLAEAVGVSGQAVSKWESGGNPDIELLQPIADYFAVSVDRLFGREALNSADLRGYLRKTTDINERTLKIFEFCWQMEFAAFETGVQASGYNEADNKMPDITEHYQNCFSQILLDSGMTSLNMDNDMRYFFVAPQPEEGWGNTLHYKEIYKDMFTFLADEAALQALLFLYARESAASFTPKLLEKQFGIAQPKAMEILDGLQRYRLVRTQNIELDDEMETVYNFNPNPAMVPFLMFLEELIRRPNSFICFQSGRQKPYLYSNLR